MANRNTRRQKLRRKAKNKRQRAHAAGMQDAFQDGFFVIRSKSRKPGLRGMMLTDPLRAKIPEVTDDVAQAKRFHGRNGAHKFLKRNPAIARKFAYQRLALVKLASAA